MIRIIRTARLRALHTERAELTAALRQARRDAETWTDRYLNATSRCAAELGRTLTERVATQTEADLRADLAEAEQTAAQYEQRIDRLRRALADARATTGATASVLAEMRADLDQIRTDAANPETGTSFRAALAYATLRRMYEQQRAAGVDLGFDEEPATDGRAEGAA
jgi:predicted RNase H-like nuclease (RuvC/YqgF family)